MITTLLLLAVILQASSLLIASRLRYINDSLVGLRHALENSTEDRHDCAALRAANYAALNQHGTEPRKPDEAEGEFFRRLHRAAMHKDGGAK